MQYDEQIVVVLGNHVPQIRQHIPVRTVIGIQLPFARTDVDAVVGLFGKKVDQRTVRNLIRYEQRPKSGLFESRNNTFLLENIIVISRRNGAEQDRHALMGRIALRQHIAERHQAVADPLL